MLGMLFSEVYSSPARVEWLVFAGGGWVLKWQFYFVYNHPGGRTAVGSLEVISC